MRTNLPGAPASRGASWTAPAKRSGDGAFARTRGLRAFENRRTHESGVALPAAVHGANELSGCGVIERDIMKYRTRNPQAIAKG